MLAAGFADWQARPVIPERRRPTAAGSSSAPAQADFYRTQFASFGLNVTAGTLMMFASARPFKSTTGIDNNGDRANNDWPVVAGHVIGKRAAPAVTGWREG